MIEFRAAVGYNKYRTAAFFFKKKGDKIKVIWNRQ